MTLDPAFDLPGAGFVLLGAGGKFPPLETAWQNRPHSYPEAVNHASRGGNVGLMAGPGGLGGLDLDDPSAFAGLELPQTLVWETRPGRLGLVFRWSDDPANVLTGLNKRSNLAQLHLYKNGEHVGEIKIGRSYQVVPPSWKEIDGQRVDYKMIEPAVPAEIPLAWLIGELQKLGITFSQKEESRLDANATKLESMTKEARQKRAESDEARNRRYAEAALAGEVEAVRSAPAGDRNNRLNVSACKLGGWITAGVLTGAEVESALALAAMDAGLAPEEIMATLKSGLQAGQRTPRAIPHQESLEIDDLPLTEGGNASRLVKLHGQNIKYVHDRHKWLVWAGAGWEFDSDGRIMRLVEDVVKELYRWAAQADNKDDRVKYAAFAEASDRYFHLKNTLGLASYRDGIAITSQVLDRDRWLIGAGPLVIEAKTGAVRQARREDLITKRLGTEYQPGLACPMWEAFLDRIFDRDLELISYIKRAVGYSLTGSMEEQVFFFCHGLGHNGKSVFLETIRALVGDYGASASFETFLLQRNQSIRNDLAALAGKRFITAKETEEGSKFAMSVLKSWTGGDEVTARFLHAEYFSFHPEGKIWLAANSKPTISERNLAAWRRVHLIPFNVTIPAAERNKGLTDELNAELPGILLWALEGLAEYLRIGLNPPKAVKAATDQYRRENDSLQAFIGECCHVDKLAYCRGSELFARYQQFCGDTGHKPLSKQNFGTELEKSAAITRKHTKTGNFWQGIGLVGEDPSPHESITVALIGEEVKDGEGQNEVFLLKEPRDRKIADSASPSFTSSPKESTYSDLPENRSFTHPSPGGQEESIESFRMKVAASQREHCHTCGTRLEGIGARQDPTSLKWYCLQCWQIDHPREEATT